MHSLRLSVDQSQSPNARLNPSPMGPHFPTLDGGQTDAAEIQLQSSTIRPGAPPSGYLVSAPSNAFNFAISLLEDFLLRMRRKLISHVLLKIY